MKLATKIRKEPFSLSVHVELKVCPEWKEILEFPDHTLVITKEIILLNKWIFLFSRPTILRHIDPEDLKYTEAKRAYS